MAEVGNMSVESFCEEWLRREGFRAEMETVAPRPEVACHEAAHATVGVALRLPIKEVRIGSGVLDSMGGLFLGCVVLDTEVIRVAAATWTRRRKDRYHLAGTVMCLAGPAGQQMRHRRCTGHATDMEEALAYSRKVAGGANLLDLELRLTLARRRAERLLTKHRDAWTRLTDALTTVDHLDGAEVERLVGADARRHR
jgi:hypothetical protein